jgi:hypothetical protein
VLRNRWPWLVSWLLAYSAGTNGSLGNPVVKLYFLCDSNGAITSITIGGNASGDSSPSCRQQIPVNIPYDKWTQLTYSYDGASDVGGLNMFALYVDGKQVYKDVNKQSIRRCSQ